MKNLKLLLFNNFISLLLLVANNILGFILFLLTFIFFEYVPLKLVNTLTLLVAGLPLCFFYFFFGKRFFKKVNKVFCFVSPIAFLLTSLFSDILVYFQHGELDLLKGFLIGDSNYLLFLVGGYPDLPFHLSKYFFCMMSIATTIVYYLILVISNLYKQDDKLGKTV